MTPALSGAIGGALMMAAAIVAMATMSNCPRHWRIFPAVLLAAGALYGSDRMLQVLVDAGYLHDARAWVIVSAMAAAFGTICFLSRMISDICPLCQPNRQKKKIMPKTNGWPA